MYVRAVYILVSPIEAVRFSTVHPSASKHSRRTRTKMHRFLTGDELGNIKSVTYAPEAPQGEAKTTAKVLYARSSHCAIQGLKVSFPPADGSQLLAAGYSDGSASAFYLQDTGNIEKIQDWKESRLTKGHQYIGLEILQQSVISCTSNGALRLTPPTTESSPSLSALPTRLLSWKSAPDQKTFAYGGDEVDLSVWDIERAFSSPAPRDTESDSKKRKRKVLFPGELWRAKNVPNDHLGLRQPIRVTSLTYLAPDSRHLVTGTAFGDVRRYDTRATSKPLSDWKVGTLQCVQGLHHGTFEHELFVSDHGHNMFALDLRNGQVVYGYKGISGAVTSMASSASILASAASDRYVRFHSTFPPPEEVGQHQKQKGEILDKVFMNVTPTVVVWDHNTKRAAVPSPDDDDIWDGMELAEGSSEDELRR